MMNALLVFVLVSTTGGICFDTACYSRFEYEYNVLLKLINLEETRDSLV